MYGANISWEAVQLSMTGFDGGFDLAIDPGQAAIIFATVAVFALLTGAALAKNAPGKAGALVLVLLAGLAWNVMARGAALPSAYAFRLAEQVRGARAYSDTIAGVDPREIVTISTFTEPSLVFSLGTDTVLAGSTQGALEAAEASEEPVMLVLDLSRDEDFQGWLVPDRSQLPAADGVRGLLDRVQLNVQYPSALSALSICHQSLAIGTNYSRGDDVTFAIFFTRCASDGEGLFNPPQLSDGHWTGDSRERDGTQSDPEPR